MYPYGAPPPQQPPPYGTPGSWHPPQGGWMPPSAPPPPPKGSAFIPIVLAVSVLGVGSCAAVFGFAAYKAQTPEGRRQAQAKDDADREKVAALVTKLENIRSSLPDTDAEEQPCPAGTSALLAPVVDSFYLDAIAAREIDDVHFEASSMVRDDEFSDTLLNTVAQRDAGALFAGVAFAATDVDRLANKKYVVVVAIDGVDLPEVKGAEFSGGELNGRVVLVDWAAEAIVCHAAITAKSSDEVSYGGGARVKVKGVPLPTIGSTDLADAVAKDFKANVRAAVHQNLKRIGGE